MYNIYVFSKNTNAYLDGWPKVGGVPAFERTLETDIYFDILHVEGHRHLALHKLQDL